MGQAGQSEYSDVRVGLFCRWTVSRRELSISKGDEVLNGSCRNTQIKFVVCELLWCLNVDGYKVILVPSVLSSGEAVMVTVAVTFGCKRTGKLFL